MSCRQLLTILAFLLLSAGCRSSTSRIVGDERMLGYVVDPAVDSLRFYYADHRRVRYGSLGNLDGGMKSSGRQLLFAMNGGMYLPDHRPQGCFLEDGHRLAVLDTGSGAGNFYLKPNGVFFVRWNGRAGVVETSAFHDSLNARYATQSGPMLLIGGDIHPSFRKGSANLNIRNGVGVLRDGRLIFAISRQPVNLYDFASWFRSQGCADALYLDGFVSRAFVPAADWEQRDGDFGVLIGVTDR